MGRLDRVYTDAQRQAAISLQVDDGLTAAKAVARLAEHGHDDVAPFTMPAESARQYAYQARLRIKAETASNDATQDIAAGTKRLRTLALTEITRMEDQARRGKLDLDKLTKVAKVFESLDKLAKGNPARKTQTAEQTPINALASALGANGTDTTPSQVP